MNDYTLLCNITRCKIPLNETAWVTRCMHVFCPGHGQAYFSNPSPQISCPICNEINLKEVDIIHCEMNPSDMILAGITPEKAILLASKSMKLWWFQMQQQNSINYSKINLLAKKNSDIKHNYNRMLSKMKQKYEAEINALKTGGHHLLRTIEDINSELEATKRELLNYKKTYHSKNGRSFENAFTSPLSQNWLPGDNALHVTTKGADRRNGSIDITKHQTSFFD